MLKFEFKFIYFYSDDLCTKINFFNIDETHLFLFYYLPKEYSFVYTCINFLLNIVLNLEILTYNLVYINFLLDFLHPLLLRMIRLKTKSKDSFQLSITLEEYF